MSYNESLGKNSNYPMMSQSEWDSAPWNQEDIPEKAFDVDVEVVLRKSSVSVETNMYSRYFDDEMQAYVTDTEDTDWKEAYSQSRHTIPELLGILKEYVEEDLEKFKGSKRRQQDLQYILDDIEGWDVVDESYTEV